MAFEGCMSLARWQPGQERQRMARTAPVIIVTAIIVVAQGNLAAAYRHGGGTRLELPVDEAVVFKTPFFADAQAVHSDPIRARARAYP